MSPEQARAESVDGRSDLYSLGAVLYECLVGKPPYDAADPFTIALMHVTHPMPQLPPPFTWLQPLLAGLMAKNADDRFPTGDAFAAAIDQLLATAPEASVLKEAPSPRKRATPRLATTSGQGRGVQGISGGGARAPAAPAGSRRRMWFTVGAVAGALLVAAGIWRLVGRDPATPGVPPMTVVPAQPIEPGDHRTGVPGARDRRVVGRHRRPADAGARVRAHGHHAERAPPGITGGRLRGGPLPARAGARAGQRRRQGAASTRSPTTSSRRPRPHSTAATTAAAWCWPSRACAPTRPATRSSACATIRARRRGSDVADRDMRSRLKPLLQGARTARRKCSPCRSGFSRDLGTGRA